MTIYSDNIGNRFLGDCIWANHDINYPTQKHLIAHPHSSISTALTSLCTQSGLQFRNVLSQAGFNTFYSNVLLAFGANSDSIDDRFIFGAGATNDLSSEMIAFYNNDGYIPTNNTFSSTNRLYRIPNNSNSSNPLNVNANGLAFGVILTENSTYSPLSWVGCCDGESLALALYQHNFNNNTFIFRLYYGGMLTDINTNFNYYSASDITQNFSFFRAGTTFSNTGGSDGMTSGVHYIANAPKELLLTGDAQYPIVCADAQTPTSQWATDMYVFDNNATLGYPAIGRVRNLLLATGSYTIGKPVKIQGSAMPDAGFNRWLPVGQFAGKTILMRCYSSVDI